MVQTVNYKAHGKKNARAKVTAKTPETVTTGFLEGVTQEELDADAKLWTDTFNAMTPEQVAKLDELFGDINEETFPLDFSRK